MAILSDDEIGRRLSELDGWEREGNSLRKDFKRKDFVDAVEFVQSVVPVAEEMNHHPDVSISWNKVTLSLSTHSEGGITENDFELASRLDRLS